MLYTAPLKQQSILLHKHLKKLARTGVKVTSVSPGMVETPMTEGNDFGGLKS